MLKKKKISPDQINKNDLTPCPSGIKAKAKRVKNYLFSNYNNSISCWFNALSVDKQYSVK